MTNIPTTLQTSSPTAPLAELLDAPFPKPAPVMLLSLFALAATGIVAALWVREAGRETRLARRTRNRLAQRPTVPNANDIIVA